tara:strand:- start:1835 stop:2551 length:717 start_codon:yes stop_codon:yes gene_type:complete
MQTRTQIANNALSYLSAGSIVNLNDDDAKAKAIKGIFDQASREVIRTHRWSCCIGRAELSKLSRETLQSGNFGYANAYQLPTDCIRILDINGEPWSEKAEFFDLNGRQLLSDLSEIFLRYVKWEDDVSQWDPLLADAVSVKIAMKVARQITTDGISAEDLERIYRRRLEEARTVDAMEVGSGENSPLSRMLERSPLVRSGWDSMQNRFRRGQYLSLNTSTAQPAPNGIENWTQGVDEW